MDDSTKQPTGEPDPAGHEQVTGEDIDALVSGAAGGEPAPEGQATSVPQPPAPDAEQGAGSGPAMGGRESRPSESFELPDFGSPDVGSVDTKRISMLNDVKLNVKIELGRSRMLVEDVLKLGEGSVVELNKPAGDPVEVYVNERLVARGEVLVLNDNFCVRISEVLAADPHRVSA